MALLVGSSREADRVLMIEFCEVQNPDGGRWGMNVRPGRCSNCRVAIIRPVGGPTWRDLPCPLCGSGTMQSTWESKQAKKAVLISRAEARALARGEKIEVERPLTPGIVRGMDIHEIYERVPTAAEEDLPMLNAEIARRLG